MLSQNRKLTFADILAMPLLPPEEWPRGPDEKTDFSNTGKRLDDPREKEGVVGDFCRAYTITEAMEAHLPGVYSETSSPNRMTFDAGSSHGGVRIYDDDTHLFSEHHTDPANTGHCLNAFDLVRVHKFGWIDDYDAEFSAMVEYIEDDELTQQMIADAIEAQFEVESDGLPATPESSVDAAFDDESDGLPATPKASVDAAFDAEGGAPDAGWPPLRPLSDIAGDIPAPAPFDAAVLLPDPLRQYVVSTAAAMPTAPDYIAVGLIAAIGTVIAGGCTARPKSQDGWHVTPNLWAAFIAPPGSKKSPALSAGLRPLSVLAADINREREAATRAYDDALAEHKREEKLLAAEADSAFKTARKSGDDAAKSRADALKNELRDFRKTTPRKPSDAALITDDATTEALVMSMAGARRSTMLKQDELLALFASFGRDGREGDRSFYNTAWSGDEGFFRRRVKTGVTDVERLTVSIVGAVQPGPLAAELRKASEQTHDDGFLQRFQMLVFPEKVPDRFTRQAGDSGACREVSGIVEALYRADGDAFCAMGATMGDGLPYYDLDDAALDRYGRWYDANAAKVAAEPDTAIAQHLAKYTGLVPALALIFHAVDAVHYFGGGDIPVSAVDRAIAWTDYLEAHARRVYALRYTADDGVVARLAGKIRAGQIKTGDNYGELRRSRSLGTSDRHAADTAVADLIRAGWIRIAETPTGVGGRPRKTIEINPEAVS